jgi:phage terminase large subunit
LYGGQAGPGKSHALRWGLYRDCMTIPNLNCLLLRRTFKQLESTHLLAMEREDRQIGAKYTEKLMTFSNGSIIMAGHCETTADAQNYLSTEYDRIAFDELVTFDRDPALEIMSRARTAKKAVKESGNAQVWCGTNPGGRGALWVKEFFIDKSVDRAEFPKYRPERYGFVEATLDDNPYISEEYRNDLEDLPEMRKRQLLYGDWNAFEGQFFAEWRATRDGQPWHVQELAA